MEANAIPFCIASDKVLVSYKKKLVPMCELFRQFAVESGVAEVALEKHVVRQRFHPVSRSCSFFLRERIITASEGVQNLKINSWVDPPFVMAKTARLRMDEIQCR